MSTSIGALLLTAMARPLWIWLGCGAAGAAAGAAVGAAVAAPPPAAQPVVVNNQTYYSDGGAYYRACYQGSEVAYCVVPNPNP